MTLDQAVSGQKLRILKIEDPLGDFYALRLGMGAGSLVTCVSKVPGGPVVVKFGLQEAALGRDLAKKIHVKWVHSDGSR